MPECQICHNNQDNTTYSIPEMNLGTKEEFEYIECKKCGTLQIKEVPIDLEKYYPQNYYSFYLAPPFPHNPLFRYLFCQKNSYRIFKTGLIGHILYVLSPNTSLLNFFAGLNLNLNSTILDVGCGNGALLQILQMLHFQHLYGIDAFIPEEVNGKITIWKNDYLTFDTEQKFDFIMFNGSFEHMAKPQEILTKVRSMLTPGGHCLIRVPIKTDFIWKKYNKSWFQIDAPRHFFLYTEKSLSDLIRDSGFSLERVVYDSTGNQFWASEQYQRGISLNAPNSHIINPKMSPFSKRDIKLYEKWAEKLNKEHQGDSAGFIIRRI